MEEKGKGGKGGGGGEGEPSHAVFCSQVVLLQFVAAICKTITAWEGLGMSRLAGRGGGGVPS